LAGSSTAPTTILVVCNPSEQADLRRHFAEPLSTGPVDVVLGDGGDDTFSTFERLAPPVVVVCASLDAGDTRALLEAMRSVRGTAFRAVLIGDERGPVRNALDASDFGVDRFVARPIAAKALRFAVASSIDAAAGGGITLRPTADSDTAKRVTNPGFRAARTRAGSEPSVGPAATLVGPPSPSPVLAPPDALTAATLPPNAATMVVAAMPTIPGTGEGTLPAPPRAVIEPRAATEPPPEAVRTDLRARWSALADLISDRDLDGLGDLDDDDDDLDDDPPPDAEPVVDRPPPAPVVIRPRRTDPNIKVDLSPPASPVEGPAVWQPGSTSELPPQARTTTAPSLAPVPPARAATAPPVAARSDDDRDELREPADDPSFVDAHTPPPSTPMSRPQSLPAVPPGADGDYPVREPTLIINEASPPPAVPPPPSAAPASELAEEIVVTERRVAEKWSNPTPVHALTDDPAAPRSPAKVGSEPRARLPLEPRADLGDDPPSVDEPGQVDPLDDDLREPVADEPPMRPSDPALPSGGDFARELRRKMASMAQRLFQSSPETAAPTPAVDHAPRHDHKTEIDLAALVDAPVPAGVTEIESRDETTPRPEDTPGTANTQVRIGAESGDIIRGVSDAASLLSRAFAQAFTGRATLRKGDVEKSIFFDRGRPVFAASNQPFDRMGQLLVREGKITPDQFGRCQTIVAASGRRMGEILVDLGYLKRRELLPAVRRHVEDIIYSLFAWNSGQFQMTAGDGAASERIRLSRHPAGMILEGVRRKLGAVELERLVGSAATVVEIGDKEKLATLIGTADLSPEERAAVAALDGINDLAAVARVSGIEVANVFQLAWGLIVLGVAHARRRDGDVDGDEGAVLVGETDLAIDRERVRARWHLVSDADYFALLGVRRDATGFEIKRAYEAARRDFAPDGFPAELRRELARELDDIAHVLDEAFHVLRDDGLRTAYLRHLRD
jgi:hypothetical protein